MKKGNGTIAKKILVGGLTIASTAAIALIVKELNRVLFGLSRTVINGVKRTIK